MKRNKVKFDKLSSTIEFCQGGEEERKGYYWSSSDCDDTYGPCKTEAEARDELCHHLEEEIARYQTLLDEVRK
jgi:hypothetical protein